MVVFNQNLDRNNKIYIRRLMRDMGFSKTVTIHLQNNAAVMHPVQVDLREVKDSVEVILLDIEKRLKRKSERAAKTEGEL
jgi:Fe2+ transport system protein FeoA